MEYLTSKEVSERLKISVRSAQRLMKQLPHIHAGVGRRRENLRITDAVLNEYQTVPKSKSRCVSENKELSQRPSIVHQAGTKVKRIDRR